MFYSIQQFIDPEADEKKKCKNYPYGGFSVYHECDEDFVLHTFHKIHSFDILPFWVTKESEKVTRKRCFFFKFYVKLLCLVKTGQAPLQVTHW